MTGSAPLHVDHPSRSPAPARRLVLWGGWPWLAAALSGVLLILCFPPFDQGWLVWIALAPLAAAVWWPREAPATSHSSRWRRWLARGRPFWLGYVAGVIYFTGVFYWLGALGPLFESPFLFTLPLLLASYLGVYGGFWSWFLHLLAPPGPQRFRSSLGNLRLGALAAFAWVAGEWVRGWLFSGFDWNMLAVAMRRDVVMIQIAELTGAHGLSWLAAFSGVMGVIIVRRILSELGPDFLKRVRWEFSFTMALIAGVFSYGARALFAPLGETETLRIAALQPNIPQKDWFHTAENAEKILSTIARNHRIAAAMLPPAQLIIWPEAVVPGGFFADEETHNFVLQAAQMGDFNLLSGSLEIEPDPAHPGDLLEYNSAMLLTRQGQEVQSFRKMHLVIFGEYMPFRNILPSAITDLVPGDLAAGHEFRVLKMENPALQFGPLVCFEDTDAAIVRGMAQRGAQFLVNITNDGWFLRTVGSEQHLANAVLRTVETRRPLVRCANTGVTCAIDPFGRVDRWTDNFTEEVGAGNVRIAKNQPLTFYTRHGNWLAHLSAIITGLAIAAFVFTRKSQSTD